MKPFEVVDRLAVIRKKIGISGRDLSLAIGRTDSYIIHMEQYAFSPSLKVILEIIDFYTLPPTFFFSNKFDEHMKDKEFIDKLRRAIVQKSSK